MRDRLRRYWQLHQAEEIHLFFLLVLSWLFWSGLPHVFALPLEGVRIAEAASVLTTARVIAVESQLVSPQAMESCLIVRFVDRQGQRHEAKAPCTPTGSTYKANDQIRIGYNPGDGKVIWTEDYERSLEASVFFLSGITKLFGVFCFGAFMMLAWWFYLESPCQRFITTGRQWLNPGK